SRNERWVAFGYDLFEERHHVGHERADLLEARRLLKSGLIDEAGADLLQRLIEAEQRIENSLELLQIALHQGIVNRPAIDRCLVRPALDGRGGNELRAIAHRAGAAFGDNRGILERQDDGRHVVEGGYVSRAERMVALGPLRVYLLPALLQECRKSNDGVA